MGIISALLAIALASSPTADEIAEVKKETEEAARIYADCAGFWDYMSSTQAKAGHPAAAEQLRNLGNGAQTAALWLHAQTHVVAGGKPVRYGTWLPLIAPRREAAALRASAMEEASDAEWLRSEGEKCTAMLEGQQQAIDAIRADTVQRSIDDQN
ncbi:hypothetical protein [Stenotrophomonas sp. VV52]|uniref:hypothetical protein n=1 Tax=Stenotrophomonas sp. VV52 TaxID=2066958 RepID=UPI000C9E438B|nr:hypothetical protein [Stenotrophomonas sp. VV52]